MRYNIIANLFTALLFILLPAIIFPLYIKVLDAERYGLFTFYFVILIYFKIFDLGITPAFNRFIAHEVDKKFVRNLLKNFEIFFLFLSVVIIFITFIFKNYVSDHWLISTNVSIDSMNRSIIIISLIVSTKFFISIYRGGINGLEQQIWINSVKVFFEFFSLIGGLLFIYAINSFSQFSYNFDISYLFLFFLLFSFFELWICRKKLISFLPKKTNLRLLDFSPFRKILSFILMSAITTSSWLLVNWFDRIIFSGSLNLKYYGFYVTITLFASLALMIVVSINTALLPRITNLISINKVDKMKEYFNLTLLLNISVIFSICVIIVIFSNELLIVWTGNSELSTWGHKTLTIYVLGYSSIAFTHTITTYLTSIGKLKIPTIMNIIWAPIMIFLFYYASQKSSIYFAGLYWFIVNTIYLFIYILLCYINFKDIFNWQRIIINFIKILIISFFLIGILINVKEYILFNNRLIMLIEISTIYSLIFLSFIISIKQLRELFINYSLVFYRKIF